MKIRIWRTHSPRGWHVSRKVGLGGWKDYCRLGRGEEERGHGVGGNSAGVW